ncbi:MAG: hypothetical protein H6707_07580 [Deltaproteobacteria bacterium]|nr:hypothetical protein [Deltaproteobacteria bacterium]
MRRDRLSVVLLGLLLWGCGGNDPKKVTSWPDGFLPVDSNTTGSQDLGAAPDLPQNAEGPTIEILSPTDGERVVEQLVKVRAKVTDADQVRDQTVTVTIEGAGRATTMSLTSTPDVYEATVDLADLRGKIRCWVTAEDLQGNANSLIRLFERDAGPTVEVLSPAADSRHRSSISLEVTVSDVAKLTNFEARIGATKLAIKKSDLSATKAFYSGQVKFDDAQFSPPLSGKQVLTISATNENNAKTVVERVFFVDDVGPTIKPVSQAAGDLIGGVITLEATIADPAGVLASSVKAVIGNNLDTRSVALKLDTTTAGTYRAQFDTRTLSQFDLWPVMSFRAADVLGNESHFDIQVGLDNGPPILSLDPPTEFYHLKIENHEPKCSLPFDPLGTDAADDQDVVPQVVAIRARIEDQGNDVPTAPWIPLALVDKTSPKLYVLDDETKALAVDTTGDGFCDSINPEVVPKGTTPQPGEAVAVNISPISPTGTADFRPNPNPFPFPTGVCKVGDAADPPEPVCEGISSLTVVTHYTVSLSEPAIYSIPPILGGDKLRCLGLPFDFLANQVSDGWTCVVAWAEDTLGNSNVSQPLRLFVQRHMMPRGTACTKAEDCCRSGETCSQMTCQGGACAVTAPTSAAPNCTGTLDKTTGTVDASKPCTFRPPGSNVTFPQSYPDPQLRRAN